MTTPRKTKEDLLSIWARPKNILVAVDGSKYGDAAMDWAIENLCGEADILHLVYCYTPMEEFVDLEDGIVFSPSQKDQEALRAKAEAVLRDAVVRCVGEEPHIKHEQHLLAGDPRMCISELADKINADAVVVGCRGRGAITRAVLGSVSTWLSHHLTKPLVIVRPQDEQ